MSEPQSYHRLGVEAELVHEEADRAWVRKAKSRLDQLIEEYDLEMTPIKRLEPAQFGDSAWEADRLIGIVLDYDYLLN